MIIFIVGGAKSKKSYFGEYYAERLKNDNGKLYYLATMKPYDKEDLERIAEHVKVRDGHGFITIEKQKDIQEISVKLKHNDTILLDSITSLATNEMFSNKEINEKISNKISNDIIEVSSKVKNLVIVSDYVFSDGIKYDNYTEVFKRELGRINCNVAKAADVVIESSFGNAIVHKGKEKIDNERFR
ncbi:bifunctional adenosylcobinamide kinase/adenosylcobinamide-phosphate guanylyltransferase [Clostridium sp. LP20]|uniref:bifunctional adenosylcobinamide kinase/adenosylcobinamide-phosphate guanylyltransferase n=1 Tax=Clostridium sp. LP20 TaxID=3418665 RepID=UPI003EE778F6